MKIKIIRTYPLIPSQAEAALFLFLFISLCLAFPRASHACSPASGFNPPTLAQNFERAQSVFYGTVSKNTLGKGSNQIKVKVQKTWKGKVSSTKTVEANLSSTCDGLSSTAVVGVDCVFFVSENNRVLSGVTSGDSSMCNPYGAEQSNQFKSKYDLKFNELKLVQEQSSDPEVEACEKSGGRWEGHEMGRGRLTGCNKPTKDGGKACTTGNDCESVCLENGKCHGWQKYKGCGSYRGHEGRICVD